MHRKRPTGMAEKPSDCWAMPLNRSCHMRQHDYGDEVFWWCSHGINPFTLAMRYFEEYAKQADAKAEHRERKQAARKPKRKAKIASRGFGQQRKRPWPKRPK